MKLTLGVIGQIGTLLLVVTAGCMGVDEVAEESETASDPFAYFPDLSKSFLLQIDEAAKRQKKSSIRYPFCILTTDEAQDPNGPEATEKTEKAVRKWAGRAMNRWIQPLVNQPGWTVTRAQAYNVPPSNMMCPSTDDGLEVYRIVILEEFHASHEADQLLMSLGGDLIRYDVVLHEMGHGIGLADTYDMNRQKPIEAPAAVMKDAVALTQDDKVGIRFVWSRIRGSGKRCPDGYIEGKLLVDGEETYTGVYDELHCVPGNTRR